MALRGHADIQGATDVATLYDLLPGYLPMPSALRDEQTLAAYLETNTKKTAGGQHAQVRRLPAQSVLRRRRNGGQRLLLRLPAAADRRSFHVADDVAMKDGAVKATS